MLATIASAPAGPGARNDDWAGTTSNGLAVVLDGLTEAGRPACRHGTGWYVHQLGTRLLANGGAADRSLRQILAASLAEVAELHAGTCDPAAPSAPGATVAILRMVDGQAEYLVLADAVVVIDAEAGLSVVTDRSVREHLPALTDRAAQAAKADGGVTLSNLITAQQRIRNTLGGYWVAQAAPEAVDHALVGTVPGVTGALLLTDGAAMMVTDYQAATWRELLELGYTAGPSGIIKATRELEARDPAGRVWPRFKPHDDATAVVCRPDLPPVS